MQYFLRWLITITFLVTLVSSNCPEGELCSVCNEVPNRIFELRCGSPESSNEPAFIVKFKPYKWMDIICDKNPDWSTFHLGKQQQIAFTESISFKLCHIPESRSLGEIVKQITPEDVRALSFESYLNLTMKLHRKTFTDFKAINKLVLSNNNLTEVPVDLLHDLVDLKNLDMSWNLLGELPTGFLDLPGLEIVNLSNNELEIIEPGLFRRLQNLKSLNLEFNKLANLGPTIFDDLRSLTHLNLAENDLEELPSGIFKQLEALKVVDLSKNTFADEGIPQDLFQSNKRLESVTLTDNKRQLHSLPDRMFANLKNLTAIILDGNGLVKVTKDLFAHATNIRNVSLARNEITELPEEFLKDCEKIGTLSLTNNKITDLPAELFGLMTQLEILDVSYNQMKEFNNKILDGLSSLRVLNLANNQLENIRAEGFCVLLNILVDDRSVSSWLLAPESKHDDPLNIKSTGVLMYCARNIRQVFLHGNRFESLSSGWLYSDKLELMTLHNNRLANLTMNDLTFFSGNVRVTYGGNQIETISFGEKDEDFKVHARNLKLDLGSNPINCDCRLHNLLRYRDGQLKNHLHGNLTLDMKQLNCAEPKELKYTRIEQLDRMALKCLVADPAALNATCPDKCECWRRPEDRGYLIDCSHQKLTRAPESLLSPEGYHIELNLTGNLITEMPSMMQPGYENVTKLILSNNIISNVNLDSLSDNLKGLALDSNNLTKLEPHVLDFLKNSTELTYLELHENPWICNCDTVDFLRFIQAKIPKIPDLRKVTCDSSDHPIFQMAPEDICPVFLGSIIIIGAIVAIMGISIGSLAAIYYRYQHEIKVWLYAKQCCMWFVTEDELDKDKEYDAFISFSHKDEEFVTKTLVPTLEEGPNPFNLCVHYRNWIPGDPIPTQIVQSVEDSKRTIIVLSPNFLESVWGRIEFRAAHEQALSEGRARVIIILFGEIGSVENLEPELKAYLTMNTYVKWGDPWFWEKLKYALPHPDNWIKKKKRFNGVDLLDRKVHYLRNKNSGDTSSDVHLSI